MKEGDLKSDGFLISSQFLSARERRNRITTKEENWQLIMAIINAREQKEERERENFYNCFYLAQTQIAGLIYY